MELEGDIIKVEVIANRECARESKFAGSIDERDLAFVIDGCDALAEVPCALILRRDDNPAGVGIQVAAQIVKGAEDHKAVRRVILIDKDVIQSWRGIFTGADVFELLKSIYSFATVLHYYVRRDIGGPCLPISDFVILVVIGFTHEPDEYQRR